MYVTSNSGGPLWDLFWIRTEEWDKSIYKMGYKSLSSIRGLQLLDLWSWILYKTNCETPFDSKTENRNIPLNTLSKSPLCTLQRLFNEGEFHLGADYCEVVRDVKYCFYLYISGPAKWYFNEFYNRKTIVWVFHFWIKI